jgi:hypothetical protein
MGPMSKLGLSIAMMAVGITPCLGQSPEPRFDPRKVQQMLEKTQPRTDPHGIFGLSRQLRRCWTPPLTETPFKIEVSVRLTPDGFLDGMPEVRGEPKDEIAKAVAKSAVEAIERCQPFQAPVSSYAKWKTIDIFFASHDPDPPVRPKP